VGIRKNRLASAYRFCKWPCLVGLACAAILLLGQSIAPARTPSALAFLYVGQRSFQSVDSDCLRGNRPLSSEHCRATCVKAGAGPRVEGASLTCAGANHDHDQHLGSSAFQHLVIEVVKAGHVF